MQTLYFQLIQEICEKQHYQFKQLDSFSGILAQISSKKNSILISDREYPLNKHSAVSLANDKGLMSLVLRNAGIKIPEGDYFFITPKWRSERANGKELLDAMAYANTILTYPVFVKPINGLSGHFATLIHNEADLSLYLQRMAEKYYAVMIQKPVFAEEKRVFVLDGKVKFAYHKKQATVTGDGKTPLKNLVKQFLLQMEIVSKGYYLNDAYLSYIMDKKALTDDSVLEKNTVLAISSSGNPNSGGIISEISQTIPKACEEWAANIADQMGLRLCGIDFFAPNSIKDDPSEFTVIEVNANPSLKTVWRLGHQELVKSIWMQILQAALNE